MKNVAILGCGPTGLLAAHELSISGFPAKEIGIFSKKRKSKIFGAQYLHEPIEGLNVGRQVIRYRIEGSRVGYLQKVYGSAWDGTISDELAETRHYAWDIRECYDKLWYQWEPYIMEASFSPRDFGAIYEQLTANFDLVINTVPRNALCSNYLHGFNGTEIWASGDAPEWGQECPVTVPEGDVIYNGEQAPRWYRAARIFNHTTVEWPVDEKRDDKGKPPIPGVDLVKKPLSHNCTCWPKLHHLGRFGRWQNGVLAHHTIRDTQDLLLNGVVSGEVRAAN